MDLEVSLPRLQVPAAHPYPELDQSSPCPHPTSWRSILIFFPSRPGSSKRFLSLRFPHQNPIFCAELRWKFAFDVTWRLYRVEIVALFAQKSRYNCKDKSSFACRAHLSRSYSQHSTNKMHSILPYGTLQQRALIHVSSHKGSSSGRKYQIIVHKT